MEEFSLVEEMQIQKIADYLLTVNDQDLAVIEAKSDEKPLSEGVAQ